MNVKLWMFVSVLFLFVGVDAMAIDETAFTVVKKSGVFELRDYAPHLLAETVVEGSLEEAGNKAFRRLFRYISGENRSRNKIAMTAPVSQESTGEKIVMTAPVGQQRSSDKWSVSFTMPASYSLDTLPVPNDPAITLRQVPFRRMAAVRYSGTWSEKNYLENKEKLDAWIQENGYKINGEPVWARYNPPFTLWFQRRNEILIPVETRTAP
jgi:effector-binding domain-containing protein